jgi:ABC-2 type transport system permease protein
MMDVRKYWKDRFKLFRGEIQKYMKYILTDHLKSVLFVGLGFLAFYYQSWLETLPANFPAALIIAVIMAIILANGTVITFLKEADVVFFLPLEEKLKSYFVRSFFLTYMLHAYIVVMISGMLIPLYLKQIKGPTSSIVLLILVLVLAKGWNLCVSWENAYFYEKERKVMDYLLRIFLNFALVYMVIIPSLRLYTFGIAGIMGAYLFYLFMQTKGRSLPWERLIEQEQRRMALFYRVANMFTDVPGMKGRAKRRKWLDIFTRGIGFASKETYSYLYIRTFLRSGDYAGLYIRLVCIGIILLTVIPNQYIQLAVGVFFLYLISFQLQTLWHHHRSLLWLSLYPIEEIHKKEALLRIMWKLTFIASILFAGATMLKTGVLIGLIAGACNVIFSYLYTRFYVQKKAKPLVS